MIFGTDMISLGHIDNEKKDNLILGKGPTDGLDNCRERVFNRFY